MSQNSSEEIYKVPIDEEGVFNMQFLPDFSMPEGGTTPKENPSTSVRGWNKQVGNIEGLYTRIAQTDEAIVTLAGNVDGFQTQITQNATSITSLATDVSGNTSQITQNSTSISSLVSDVNGNSSLIQQNSTAINLRVTTADFNSQIAITEGKIAMKAGDSAGVKAQIVVDAINGGSVNIAGARVNISGNTTFSATANTATTANNTANTANSTANTANATAQQAQTAVNQANADHTALIGALGDLAYDDLVETAQLGNTVISGGYIKTSLLTANNIVAGIFTGLTFRTSASGKRVEIQNSNNRLSVFDASNNNVLNIGFDTQADSANNLIYARDINNGTGPIAFFEGWRDSNVLRVNGYTNSNFPTIYVDSTNNERNCLTLSNRGNSYSALRLVASVGSESIDFGGIWLHRIGNDLYWDGNQIN